jgi:hypothetical protein
MHIESAEELYDLVTERARKYGADELTLSTGFRHTICYNYNAFEFNFLTKHCMTVISPNGNKCELTPEAYSLYTIASEDPHCRHFSGIIVSPNFNDMSNYAVPEIMKSNEFKESRTISPVWMRGVSVKKNIPVADKEQLMTYCRIAYKHVISEFDRLTDLPEQGH